MAIIHATKETFKNDIKNGLVLVDFWAPWCGPCKMIAPVLSELDASSNGEYKIVKVNVDEEQDLARNFGIMSIPTLLLFKDGAVVDQRIGFAPKDAFIELINKHK